MTVATNQQTVNVRKAVRADTHGPYLDVEPGCVVGFAEITNRYAFVFFGVSAAIAGGSDYFGLDSFRRQ